MSARAFDTLFEFHQFMAAYSYCVISGADGIDAAALEGC
jgi:hypothetical protein